MSENRQKYFFLPVFVTVFIDLLGLGIVIPIFAPLFLDPSRAILPASFDASLRNFILGLLLASYSIAQFFGAPILGAWSDRVGRKKILLLSIVGTMIGHFLFGVGILLGNIPLLFFSRMLDGFTGGNVSIILSAIADRSDEKSKAKNFGLVGMAFGLGFILGPFFGGKLADPSLVSWFTFATPFWTAAFLSFINILLVLWAFPETLKAKIHTPIHFFTGMQNFGKAFQMKNLRDLFFVIFLFSFGFNFFAQFFQVFLVQKFQFTQSQIGDLFAYIGLWIAFTQGIVMRFVSKKFHAEKIVRFSLLLLGAGFFIILAPSTVLGLYLLQPLIAFSNGLLQPSITTLVSNAAGPESQGEIMGIQQAVQSVSQGIPPIIAGIIVSFHKNLPILTAGIFVFAAWILFLRFLRERQTVFHEV